MKKELAGGGRMSEKSRSAFRTTKEKLERLNRLYSILIKINHSVVRAQEHKVLYQEACRIVVEDGLFKIAWIGIINKETCILKPVAQWGFNKEREEQLIDIFTNQGPKQDGIIRYVITTGEHCVSHDIKEQSKGFPWHEDIIKNDINSCAVFPLKNDSEIIGVIVLYSTEYSFVEEQEINLLKSLSDDISFAVRSIEKENHRKEIEEELRQSEERYRKIFELSPEAIFVHSQFTIMYANIAAAKLLGISNPGDIVGRNLMDFVYRDYHQMVKETKENLHQYGIPMPFAEQKYIRIDGSVIDVETAITQFPYRDKNTMVSVVRDITERKKLEHLRKASEENMRLLNEAREYDKLKTEFFANISHELRTPINVILSAIQLLNLYITEGTIEKDNVKIEKYFYTMQQNCYRLLRLVSNIIDITKMDAGFFELQLENHNIVSIIEDITISVSQYIEHKGITLLFDTDVEEKNMAFDPDKMERIILNLLSNSVKFTDSGGQILVNFYDKGEKVIITVKDNGIGIPESKKELIFERFQQVDKSLTRSHEGSGIGLSIVKSLVELHGGTIKVESEYGRGTEFIIELPVRLIQTFNSHVQSALSEENIEKINIEFSDIYSL